MGRALLFAVCLWSMLAAGAMAFRVSMYMRIRGVGLTGRALSVVLLAGAPAVAIAYSMRALRLDAMGVPEITAVIALSFVLTIIGSRRRATAEDGVAAPSTPRIRELFSDAPDTTYHAHFFANEVEPISREGSLCSHHLGRRGGVWRSLTALEDKRTSLPDRSRSHKQSGCGE